MYEFGPEAFDNYKIRRTVISNNSTAAELKYVVLDSVELEEATNIDWQTGASTTQTSYCQQTDTIKKPKNAGYIYRIPFL
jgi:hypothetical protein